MNKNLLRIHELKTVKRRTYVKDRNESSAEHSWSVALISRAFLPEGVNGERVLKILIYHDLVEIEAGDVSYFDKQARKAQEETEKQAVDKLRSELPGVLGEELYEFWSEYQARQTPEARFAYACDRMDGLTLRVWNKDRYKDFGISWEMELKMIEEGLSEFPEMKNFALDLVKEAKLKGMFE